MDKWISSFITGAILSLFLPKVPVLFCLFFGFGAGFLALYYPLAKYLCIGLLGSLWINYAELNVHPPELLSHDFTTIEQRTFSVDGKIVNIPRIMQDKQVFTFSVKKLNNHQISKPILLRLSWKTQSQRLGQGQKWHLNVRVKPAHGYGNIGSFNYRTWLRHHNIVYTGYVLRDKSEVNTSNILLDPAMSFRQKLYLNAENLLTDKSLNGLLKALSFGERGDISNVQRKVLQVTATGHLIAISGLHLGLIASGSFFIFSLIFKYLPLRFLPARRQNSLVVMNHFYIVILLSLGVTFFYAYISGSSLPTLRALLMILGYWILRMLEAKVTMKTLLLYVVFVIILLWPFSLLSISFWLSFYAVALIFLMTWRFSIASTQPENSPCLINGTTKGITKYLVKIWRASVSLFYLQLLLSVTLLPLTLLINYQFSLLAIVANMIAVPVMTLTAIPLCLLATLSLTISAELALFFFNGAYFFIDLLWDILVYLSEQSWAVIPVGSSGIMALALVIFYGVFRGVSAVRWRWFDGVFLMLGLMLLLYFSVKDEQSWQVNVLDVGQGLAVVIEKDHQVILYDTGASYPGGFNFIDAVVMPYLKSQGQSLITEVMISHSDNDHAGGLPRLKLLQPILPIRANDSDLEPTLVCQQGKVLIWKNLSFEFLWPLSSDKGRDNDDSCVVKISDGKHSVLFPGDISTKVEQALIDSGINLQANILIAPHHGSKTSSSEAFIHEVSPDIVVFSSGYFNRWNMPHESVVMRYQAQGIETFTTFDTGMVRFEFSKHAVKTSTFKNDLWPFWFAHQ